MLPGLKNAVWGHLFLPSTAAVVMVESDASVEGEG